MKMSSIHHHPTLVLIYIIVMVTNNIAVFGNQLYKVAD
jgi:hypothetical protein